MMWFQLFVDIFYYICMLPMVIRLYKNNPNTQMRCFQLLAQQYMVVNYWEDCPYKITVTVILELKWDGENVFYLVLYFINIICCFVYLYPLFFMLPKKQSTLCSNRSNYNQVKGMTIWFWNLSGFEEKKLFPRCIVIPTWTINNTVNKESDLANAKNKCEYTGNKYFLMHTKLNKSPKPSLKIKWNGHHFT